MNNKIREKYTINLTLQHTCIQVKIRTTSLKMLSILCMIILNFVRCKRKKKKRAVLTISCTAQLKVYNNYEYNFA